MSYDIRLTDPKTGETVQFDTPHQYRGGTYLVGGTKDAWLNITSNYGPFFRGTIDEEKGIRALYGKTGQTCIPILQSAIERLGGIPSEDYWAPTAGNAGVALHDLLQLCKRAPQAILKGD